MRTKRNEIGYQYKPGLEDQYEQFEPFIHPDTVKKGQFSVPDDKIPKSLIATSKWPKQFE